MAQPGPTAGMGEGPRSDPVLDLLHFAFRATVFLTCVLLMTMVVLVALTGRDAAIVSLAGVITALFGLVAAVSKLAFAWLSSKR